MLYAGGCHCGNLNVVLATDLEPDSIDVRACQCSFCRKHATLAIADPNGRLAIRVADPTRLSRYMFGQRTAEYLVCRECGVYVAAVSVEAERRAILIVNALDDHCLFTKAPMLMDYDAESRNERIARRTQRWMPVTLDLASGAAS
jgi:hypothetical protein